MANTIEVKNLIKNYKSYKRGQGFMEAFKSLFKRQHVISQAVKSISFSIKQGELVGFVGQNGAGKSTTIKMLTGVLYPSEGEISVLGFKPWDERSKYVKHIGAVFGQKSQLWWDIPPIDAFYLSKEMYEIPAKEFEERLALMVKILGVGEIMKRPTRDLSLGERMKCEFIMALLHNPKVLFLDEPTIGVDALAKEEIRNFLAEMNRKHKTTVILTTHDMDDIEELCKRVIVIDEGRIIYDGDLGKLKEKYIRWKTVDVEFTEVKDAKKFKSLIKKVEVLEDKGALKSFKVSKDGIGIPDFVQGLMSSLDVIDLTVHEARLEHVIKEIYREQGKK